MTISAILTDIEGTTSSISFVKEMLFPYAAQNMAGFLHDHWSDPRVTEAIAGIRQASGQPVASPDEAARLLREWIAEDRKQTQLKTLQGMIWRSGYESGAYQAHVYEDAARRLRQWHDAGLPLYIYSSGSIAAQKLFFRHSEAGDLTPLFSGYFDTTSGGKKEADSYRTIASAIGLPAERILFLSDVEAELDAARQAGMRTTLLDRDDSASDSDHPRVSTFDAIGI